MVIHVGMMYFDVSKQFAVDIGRPLVALNCYTCHVLYMYSISQPLLSLLANDLF